jgi:hypothetical protein
MSVEKDSEGGDQGTDRISATREFPWRREENACMVITAREKGLVDGHEVTNILSNEHSSFRTRPAQKFLVRLLSQGRVFRTAPFRNWDNVVSLLLKLSGDSWRKVLVKEQLHAVSSLLCRRSQVASASAASPRFRSIHSSISSL